MPTLIVLIYIDIQTINGDYQFTALFFPLFAVYKDTKTVTP